MLGGQSGFIAHHRSFQGTLVFDGAPWPPVDLGCSTLGHNRHDPFILTARLVLGSTAPRLLLPPLRQQLRPSRSPHWRT